MLNSFYNHDEFNKKWLTDIEKTENAAEKLSKKIYSTEDYYNTGWHMVRHGILILDFRGNIIEANPFFCEKIGYQHDELIGKNVNEFCVKADDLYASDSINILTLLQSINQQATNQCEVNSKDQKLLRCRWVANRIPSDLKYPFSHSIVHVYFLAESSYKRIIESVNKMEKKESNKLYNLLDSVWTKSAVILLLILTALNGSLPDLVLKIIDIWLK